MDKQGIIRIGILGTADIARRQVIPALESLPEQFRLMTIGTRNLFAAKADPFFNRHPLIEGYQSLLDKGNIDAIYIPLPNALHAEWIDQALDQGIHVLVEKSMTCSLEETTALNQKARKKGLVLLENFQFRFHHQLAEIVKRVGEGAIGDLRCVRSSFGFPPFANQDNIRYQKELGGGSLLDAGAYPIKIAQIFLGMDIRVAASSLHIDTNKGVDTWGGAYLKQNEGDLFAEIAFGFDHQYQCSLELWGTKGKLTAGRIFTAPPGFQTSIEIETSEGKQSIPTGEDNHFKNMLLYFHSLVMEPSRAVAEYMQNINQARLLAECQNLSHES